MSHPPHGTAAAVESDTRFEPIGQFPLPQTEQARFAADVVATLRARGFGAYWVGGCVRDVVLGRVPKDFDVATSARPDQVSALFARVVEVGAAFGVVCVLGPGQPALLVEVATFRAEDGYSDRRRPDAVRFVDAEQDVLRRDFTMNGLLMDPLDARQALAVSAGVVDLVGGLTDLRAGLLRAIGQPEHRFAEDALRLLRAVRFSCRFGLEIEPRTADAMRAAASGLVAISRERVRVELEGMLAPSTAARALRSLVSCELAPEIFADVLACDPELRRAIACFVALAAAAPASPGASERSGVAADAPAVAPFVAALATVCWSVRCPEDRAAMGRFGERFRLSNPEVRAVTTLWRLVDGLLLCASVGQAQPMREGASGDVAPDNPALARLLRVPEAPAALALARALVETDASLSVAARESALGWMDRTAALRAATDLARWWPSPHVDGQTLQARGHRPGAGFREALDAALDAQLRGADADVALVAAEAELARVRQLSPPRPGAQDRE